MKHRFLTLVCVVLLQACAQTRLLQSGELVHTSEFDGDWTAVMKRTAARQSWSDVQFECDEFTEPFFLRVRQGVVSGYLETDENYSFRTQVAAGGAFKTFIPVDSFYRYKKKVPIEQSNIALLLTGQLSPENLTGRFVIADTRMDLHGCSTDVEFIAL